MQNSIKEIESLIAKNEDELRLVDRNFTPDAFYGLSGAIQALYQAHALLVEERKAFDVLDAEIQKAHDEVVRADDATGEYGEGPEPIDTYYEALGYQEGLQRAREILAGAKLLV
jgi:hypothetical protein